MREKFIDKDDDAWDSLDEAIEGNHPHVVSRESLERYIHEDDCIEKTEGSSVLKFLPLFGYHADENGQIWVKSPFNIKGLK